jgi:hypothetical protein
MLESSLNEQVHRDRGIRSDYPNLVAVLNDEWVY